MSDDDLVPVEGPDDDEDDWYPGGWFGASWGAPVCTDERYRDTPVGWLCVDCVVPITETDQGLLIPYTYGATNEETGRYEPAGTTLTAEHLACFLDGMGLTDNKPRSLNGE